MSTRESGGEGARLQADGTVDVVCKESGLVEELLQDVFIDY